MLLNNRLFLKLQIAIGLIAALVVILGGVLLWSERTQSEVTSAAEATQRKQMIIERVDGIIYAVVMESRGLYMAETPQRIEQFGKGLLGHLERLKTATTEWRGLLEPGDEADFRTAETQISALIQLRTELVGAARTNGAAAARAMGDNDANRATRVALNKALERLTERYRLRTQELDARTEVIKQRMTLITLTLTGGIVVLAFGIWAWTTRRIATPVSFLTADLDAVRSGALETSVRNTAREDEVGAIAKSIEAFRARLLEDRTRAAREQDELSARTERARKLEEAIRSFETAAESRVSVLGKTSGELHMAASTLSAGAEETARQADIVSEASDQMNANIDTLATVGGQLVSAIGEIAVGMGRASEVSERAHGLSASMATKFSDLEQTVSTIGHVVDLINSIAAQTNLLALNATIEAARAGEAGRGFAIVAQEVKQLAAQTTQATAEIVGNVSRVQAVSAESVAAVASINAAIEDMRTISQEVSTAVENQRAATQEIAENVRSAASGTQAVTDNIIGVAQAAEETGSSSMKVLQSAGQVQEEAARIKEEVERFLGAIRAA